jgi:MFS family permease
MAFGVAFASFGSYSVSNFVMAYIVGVPGQMAGMFADLPLVWILIGLGIGNAIFYAGGTYLGGVVADHFGKRSVAAYGLVPAVTIGIAAMAAAAAWATGSAFWFFAFLSGHIFFLGFYLGPSFSVAQNLAGVSVRATSTAVFFFVLNLIALGGGPTYTGFIWDRFTAGDATQLEALRLALWTLSVPWMIAVALFLVSAWLLPKDWVQVRSAPEVAGVGVKARAT